jgi:uncharacterized repeat protein (TIGR01451 family)
MSNNDASAPFQVVLPNADLELYSKSKSPSPVAPGADITSTIVVRNLGPSAASWTPATPIRVTDTLSADETYVSVSGNWSCSVSAWWSPARRRIWHAPGRRSTVPLARHESGNGCRYRRGQHRLYRPHRRVGAHAVLAFQPHRQRLPLGRRALHDQGGGHFHRQGHEPFALWRLDP